jgi:hypothetical protein
MTSTHRIRLATAVAVATLGIPAAALAGRVDGRSADTLDAAYAAQQEAVTPTDGRSPDTLDAASSPHPIVFAVPGGFDWGDAGIGAGITSGVLVAVAGVGALRLRRHARGLVQATLTTFEH